MVIEHHIITCKGVVLEWDVPRDQLTITIQKFLEDRTIETPDDLQYIEVYKQISYRVKATLVVEEVEI